ncbi:MAG: HAMP domain-containing protein [Betaproteobacteria bacterium]|nr:HAMP domain-containing protein [Betaproteobacteria bacterium]
MLLIVGSALAGVLLFLLASASANTTLFAQHYPLLVVLNAVLAGALAVLVIWQLLGFWRGYRLRQFGSRLTLRLLVLLAGMAIAPGVLVYTVSVQFLVKSIESWFDVKVDAALEGGISLGQAAIDQMLSDLNIKGRTMATELADRTVAQQMVQLNRLREQAGAQDAVVVTAGGKVVASASADLAHLVPELPAAQILRQARANRGYSGIDATAGRPLSLQVVVPIPGAAIGEEARFLQLRRVVPETISRSAEVVEAAYRDYRELALSRQGLKRIYIVTLTLALVMALFVAIAVAFILSARLSDPLARLAEATQAVARGDFSRQTPVTSRDELGVLTESFNSMTRQLDEARQVVEANRVQTEAARAHLENILANLSAGALVFDADLRLQLSNHSAAAILGDQVAASTGQPLASWRGALEAFAHTVRSHFVAAGESTWQIEHSLAGTGKTLLARGSGLPAASGGGFVLVFDDITQLIHAQRATAWAEVARRLAHEIKNPLTPIQLSAERLEMKLAGHLSAENAEILRRGTRTIVNQVQALKSMVDDFRDYARLPAPVFAPLDLNALIVEVLSLYESTSLVPVRELAAGLPPVIADSQQVRQVIHNLVQNAQDALSGRDHPRIEIRTEAAGPQVRMTVTDNGSGFPEEMLSRIFEPYVTSKQRGTGLGLAIVKKIVDEHHGAIAIENHPGRGASVRVLLPVAGVAAGTETSARAA